MTLQWIGVAGGLGNRLIALGSILALSKSLETEITFPWPVDLSCSSKYSDLFDEMQGIHVEDSNEPIDGSIGKSRWEPMGIFTDFQRILEHSISLEEYCYHFVDAMKSIKFRADVVSDYRSHYTQDSVINNLAIHIRRTDMIDHHRHPLGNYFSSDRKVKRRTRNAFRELGIIKSIQYSILSSNSIRAVENNYLAKIISSKLSKGLYSSYSIYVDSKNEIEIFQKQLNRQGISSECYFPSYCNLIKNSTWGSFGRRNTSTRDALIEILGMSSSSGILQNISTSTFSICSSIIGGVPILTSQPRHWFWKTMQNVFGKPIYDVRIDS